MLKQELQEQQVSSLISFNPLLVSVEFLRDHKTVIDVG